VTEWLIDETPSMTSAEVSASLPKHEVRMRGGSKPNLAVLLNDMVVHDAKKLFGGAEVRLDAIVVHGLESDESDPRDFYQPTTVRFSNVRDGDRLPIEEPGLLAFYGKPRHFLDITFLMSRDRRDSEDLGNLISAELNSSEWKQAAGALLGVAVAAPPAAAIVAAMSAAGVVANLAAQVLRSVTGNTIGVYRTAYLQNLHRFGLGRHPEDNEYRQQDLAFWYEIVLDQAPAT
jgi:hypothetical protein